MVSLTVIESLLGVPPNYPQWRVADIAKRARILPTWLSSVDARGMSISPGAMTYLGRMRRRVATLHAIGDEMSAAHKVRVIKGSKIAARMPDGILRDSGDVDLVSQDEISLWDCVLDLRERYNATPQGVNILQTEGSVHIVVAMKWPAEEPYLDKPMGADIATCAFCGDMKSVPVRVDTPDDDDLASLFAVAEERFQRRFRAKDLLDLAVIAEALSERFEENLADVVLRAARQLCLAPELRQLIKKASGWIDLPPEWSGILEGLRELAKEEKSLRRPGRQGVHRLRFGFPLNSVASPGRRIQFHEFAGGELISTPIGTCLLLDTPTIPSQLHDVALAAAKQLSDS